jgi:hypothetical protein
MGVDVDEAGHDRRVAEVDTPAAECSGQGTDTRYAVPFDDDRGVGKLSPRTVQHALRRNRDGFTLLRLRVAGAGDSQRQQDQC